MCGLFLECMKANSSYFLYVHVVEQTRKAANIATIVVRQLDEGARTQFAQVTLEARGPSDIDNVDENVPRYRFKVPGEGSEFRPQIRIEEMHQHAHVDPGCSRVERNRRC